MSRAVPYWNVARIDRLRARLREAGVDARPFWKPMHLQPAFDGHPAVTNGVSQDLFERGVCLPSGSALTDDQVDLVVAQEYATTDGLETIKKELQERLGTDFAVIFPASKGKRVAQMMEGMM